MFCALVIFGNSSHWTPLEIVVAIACLVPLLAFGFGGKWVVETLKRPALPVRLSLPLIFALPYIVTALADRVFRPVWLAVYVAVPLAVSLLLWLAARIDPQQRGSWCDYAVLLLIGLAVDLRWFEPAWPAHLHSIGKTVLLDAGLYGFLVIRGLTGCGIDFRARWRDLKIGLRELLFYAPLAVALGLALGFLHVHRAMIPWWFLPAWLYTILFIAIPEEIFFRGWMQNLIERRMGRVPALIVTSIIFGLSHFNKRAVHFNWQYVLLATIAGIFYGRAWRADRRVAASAITHASVDTIWSIWLR
jgi:membrane protease YdiL (CAAX protease family)